MSVEPRDSGNRVVSAFFDASGAAEQAVQDLVDAGIPRDQIAQTSGLDAHGDIDTSGGRGLWASLRDLFLPDEDRFGYEEGLRRGGTLLTVRTDDAHHDLVVGVLDTDGAVDMDDREAAWRSEGWRFAAVPGSGLVAGSTLDAGVNAPAIVSSPDRARAVTDDWRTDDAARVAATGAPPRTVTRDWSTGRPRLRSYILGEPEEAGVGSFSADRDRARIVERMDVISADGQNIGQVDHLDDPDHIKLARSSSPDGQHHLVPFTWIDHVDRHVHLKKTLAEIKDVQRS